MLRQVVEIARRAFRAYRKFIDRPILQATISDATSSYTILNGGGSRQWMRLKVTNLGKTAATNVQFQVHSINSLKSCAEQWSIVPDVCDTSWFDFEDTFERITAIDLAPAASQFCCIVRLKRIPQRPDEILFPGTGCANMPDDLQGLVVRGRICADNAAAKGIAIPIFYDREGKSLRSFARIKAASRRQASPKTA